MATSSSVRKHQSALPTTISAPMSRLRAIFHRHSNVRMELALLIQHFNAVQQ